MDQGEIRWAPNSSCSLDDSVIDSYEVWIVDSCGQKLELVGALSPRIQVWTAEMLECGLTLLASGQLGDGWRAGKMLRLPHGVLIRWFSAAVTWEENRQQVVSGSDASRLPPCADQHYILVYFNLHYLHLQYFHLQYFQLEFFNLEHYNFQRFYFFHFQQHDEEHHIFRYIHDLGYNDHVADGDLYNIGILAGDMCPKVTIWALPKVTTTFTTRTVTYTIIPGDCPLPLTDVTQNALDCLSRTPGCSICEVVCAEGFEANATTLTCGETEIFEGPLPTCTRPCIAGLPGGLGIVTSDCEGKVNGQSCEVSCASHDPSTEATLASLVGPRSLGREFTGDDQHEYLCNPTGFFEGPGLECAVPTCAEEDLPSGFDTTDCANTELFRFCFVRCPAGYQFNEAVFLCQSSGIFLGTAPECQRLSCSSNLLPQQVGLNLSDCLGTFAGSSCLVSCELGYEGDASIFSCSLDGTFNGLAPSCARKVCPIPSRLVAPELSTDCAGVQHLDRCIGRCMPGFTGSPTELRCFDGLLTGPTPLCLPNTCSLFGFSLGSGVNVTVAWPGDCVGARTSQNCSLDCERGYFPVGVAEMSCQSDGSFLRGGNFSCLPTPCGGISTVSPFDEARQPGRSRSQAALRRRMPSPSPQWRSGFRFGDSCISQSFGDFCSVFCETGWTILGNATLQILPKLLAPLPAQLTDVPNFRSEATLMLCDAGPNSSAGYRELPSCSGMTEWIFLCHLFLPELFLTMTPMLIRPISAPYLNLERLLRETPVGQRKRKAKSEQLTGGDDKIGLPNILGVQHDCLGKTTLQTCTVNASFGFTMAGPESSAVLQCHIDGQFLGTVPEVRTSRCPSPNFDALSVGSTCENKSIGAECWAFCKSGFTGDPQPYECVADEAANVIEVRPLAANISCQNSSSRRLGLGHLDLEPRFLFVLSRVLGCIGFDSNQPAVDGFGLALPQYEHSCSLLLHNEVCIAHCSLGWEMTGSATVLVCDNGALSGGVLPACVPRPCSYNVPSAVGLQHNCSNVTTGGICMASCTEEGFEYSGGPELFECLPSGTFTGTLPPCQRRSCLDLVLDDSKFAHNCRDMVFLDTCGVTCAQGWNLVGWASQFECGSEGDITGVPPTCVPWLP
ncbi:SELP [Symbiodinium sp. CCMP2456]|nr:SELP [Symbiodinium sp. CCMP2456]